MAEAQERLPDLIRRALDGEEVVIAENERLAVRLAPTQLPSRATLEAQDVPQAANDLTWLRRHRVGRPGPVDAAALVRQMRDEGY